MAFHKSSPKIYRSLKCELPSKTINRIAEGFKKIGLSICYAGSRVSSHGISLHSGTASISEIGLNQNGKGRTRLEAMASAYAELAERFSAFGMDHCFTNSPQNHIESNYQRRLFLMGAIDRPGEMASGFISPHALLDSKIEVSKDLGAQLIKHELTQTYVDCYDVSEGVTKKVPINFLQYIARGNGLAAGNTFEEALSQAICEIIERHAASKFLIHKEKVPTIKIGSIKDEQLRRYICLFHNLGLKIVIKDLSSVSNIPALCLITIDGRLKKDPNPYRRQEYRRFSFGCALDAKQALIRCFTEELQGFDTRSYLGKRHVDDNFWSIWTRGIAQLPEQDPAESKIHVLQYEYLADTAFAEEATGTCSFSDLPSYENDDAYDDVKILKQILEKSNRNIFVVDFTHPVLDFPVVQAVIPGMSDVVDFYYPEWINETAIPAKARVALLNYLKYDLTKYSSTDSWTKSRKGIREVLDTLESKFILFGNADVLRVGRTQVWLFYIAYRLSLFLDDPFNSLRYLQVIRNSMRDEADLSLSEQAQYYFRCRCSGMDKKTSLRRLGKKYGRPWQNRINSMLNTHDLKHATLLNPFKPIFADKRRLHQLIKTYFR